MPMPKPRPGETHDEFFSRCMADEGMNDEFPEEEQRGAVCQRQWEETHGDSGALRVAGRDRHLLRAVYGQPWAITAAKLEQMCAALNRHHRGQTLSAAEIAEIVAGPGQRGFAQPTHGVAVLPLHGVLAQRANLITMASGGTSTEQFGAALREALATPSVRAVVIDVDSPGGEVFGVPELADIIHSARGDKPIVAVANAQAASAAYWLASQADEVIVTPSGEVGSIGVIAAHEDVSAQMEQEGRRVTIVSAGRYKAEWSPYQALSDEGRGALQKRVDEYYDLFVRAVARGRAVKPASVASGMGEGRMVGGPEAIRLGMADRVDTLERTVRRLMTRPDTVGSGPRRASASADPILVPFPAADQGLRTAAAQSLQTSTAAMAATTAAVVPEPGGLVHYRVSIGAGTGGGGDGGAEADIGPPERGASARAAAGGSDVAAAIVSLGGGVMPIAGSRYQELVQQRADLVREGQDIVEAAERAGHDLTPEQVRAAKERETRVAWLTEQIDVLDSQREQERIVAGASRGTATPRISLGGPAMSGARPMGENAPWGQKYGVRMIQAADGALRFGGIPSAFDVALGDFLQAVAHAMTPGGQSDPRLFRAQSGGSTGSPEGGGFLVRTDFSLALMEKAMAETQLARRCRTIEISGDSDALEAPYVDETSRATGSRWGGVQVYRRAEAATVTSTRPALAKFDLRLEDLMGLAYVTDRLLRDAAALGQVYRDAFTDEFAFKLDDEVFRGSGAGECLGIMNGANAALISVAAETGQTADTVVAENVMKMHARMWPRSRANGVWFINVEVEPQLQQMQLDLGTGGQLVYMPAGGLASAPFGTLYGKPVIPIEHAEELGTLGDIVFADLSQYILINKGGIDFAESMHVRFIYGENTFRWVQRVNGRPKWRTVLTPYQGTNTLSPFIALANR